MDINDPAVAMSDEHRRSRDRLRSLATSVVARKVPLSDYKDLLRSHADVLGSLRQTQESLEQTQESLRASQESLRETQAALAHITGAFAEQSDQVEQVTAIVDQLRSLPLQQRILGDAVLSLSRPAIPGPAAPVTVVVTTCDRPTPLRRALDSLVRQSRRPAQVVVVNDGGAALDDLPAEYASSLPNLTIITTPAPRSGQSVARNVGLDAATQDVIAYLDDDNEMAPGWLAAVSAHFGENPTSSAVYGGQLRADIAAPSGVLFDRFTMDDLLRENHVDTGMLAHRGTELRWNPHLRRLNDWDFAIAVHRTLGLEPLPRLASVYCDEEDPSRVSKGTTLQIFQDSVRHKHRAGPHDDDGQCALCRYRGPFGPGPSGKPGATCPNCRALPRHRLLAILLPSLAAHLHSLNLMTAVEVAPFESSAPLFEHNGLELVRLDADPGADGRVVDLIGDLQALPLADRSVPLLMVSHVLEHVVDDARANAEMRRVLLPGGLAVVQVPLRSDGLPTEEDIGASASERLRRFGQEDHVRLYGLDIIDRFEAAGLAVHPVHPSDVVPQELVHDYRLSPHEPYFLLHSSDDCADDCWIDSMLVGVRSDVEGLNTYLSH